MIKIIKLITIFFVVISLLNSVSAENSFFEEGIIKYNEKKIR